MSSDYLTQDVKSLVPGSIYTTLLEHKMIPDPFDQDNETIALNVMEHDFAFHKSFILGKDDFTSTMNLVLEGIDTLANIYLNKELVLSTDDMHRTWKVDILKYLQVGVNHITVEILSPLKYIREKEASAKNKLFGVKDAVKGYMYLRKGSSMFGWDWGPQLPDGGIHRKIYIDCYEEMAIKDVLITQKHELNNVELSFQVDIDSNRKDLKALIDYRVWNPEGELVFEAQKDALNHNYYKAQVTNPELWYPTGYGLQPLYRVKISIIKYGIEIDTIEKRIGLREITVNQVEDEFGESFTVVCNQINIFAKGANYIPEDNLLPRTNKELTKDLLLSAKQSNHNMIRVWGGGIYPEDYFYDLCDELGLLVWQDLMFACSVYDMSDARFVQNIQMETIDNLKRIRHHASIALICGNNENETAIENWNVPSKELSKTYFTEQYVTMLAEVVHSTFPNIFYWRSSPSSKVLFENSNSDSYGDMHYWGVWHSTEPITYYRHYYPRFMSEFGLQSFPSLKTVSTFTKEEDRNIFSYIMEKHQKNNTANGKILHYISEMFRYPKDFSSLLYISQLIQAEGVRYGSEHFRRNYGRCMGILYWQLNDCWPVASWSSIDYYHRYKALHYHSKKFYAPVLISIEESRDNAKVVVTNDTLETKKFKYHGRLLKLDGTLLMDDAFDIEVHKQSKLEIGNYDFDYDIKEKMNMVFDVQIVDEHGVVSSNQVSFVPDKHLMLNKPVYQISISKENTSYQLSITSDTYAKYIEIDFNDDTRFSDMYFHLLPNETKIITFTSNQSVKELENSLKVRSLVDSY